MEERDGYALLTMANEGCKEESFKNHDARRNNERMSCGNF
jgi:hypothetical protein